MTAIDMLLCTPNFNDSSSWWRGIHPFMRLKHFGFNLGIISANSKNVDFATIDHTRLVFVQRPMNVNDYAVLEKAHTCGIPTWVDFDDDYLTIQPSNPHFTTYRKPSVMQVFKQSLAIADVVTCSTAHLAQRLSQYGAKKVIVVPNSIDPELMERKRQLPRLLFRDEEKVCFWRGSNTHVEDLQLVAPQMREIISEYHDKGWRFCFLGYRPYFIVDKVKRADKVVFHSEPEMYRYINMVPRLKAQLFWTSLEDTDFNRSKSNIAWQEAALAGASIVTPDLPEWLNPGCAVYHNADQFYNTMKRMLDRNDHKELGEISWSAVKEKCTMKRAAETRWEIIQELIS